MSIAASPQPTIRIDHPDPDDDPSTRWAPHSPPHGPAHADGPADSPFRSHADAGHTGFSPAGRLVHPGMTDTEKHYAVGIHLSPLAGVAFPVLFITPLILWLLHKDKSAYVDDHGREMINFGITVIIADVLLGLSIVGWPLMPILWVVWLVSIIRGAVAASKGEYFRYPLTIRFLS